MAYPRVIEIDYTKAEPVEDTNWGYIGEHNATSLSIKNLSDSEVDTYIPEVSFGDSKVKLAAIAKASTITVNIPSSCTKSNEIGFQLCGYNSAGTLIIKYPIIFAYLSPALEGTEVNAIDTTDTLLGQINAAIEYVHTHANKSALDEFASGDKAKLDDAYSKEHTHSNKAALDEFESGDRANFEEAYLVRHTHSNMTALNGFIPGDSGRLNTAAAMAHEHTNKNVLDMLTQDDKFNIVSNTSARHTHGYTENGATVDNLSELNKIKLNDITNLKNATHTHNNAEPNDLNLYYINSIRSSESALWAYDYITKADANGSKRIDSYPARLTFISKNLNNTTNFPVANTDDDDDGLYFAVRNNQTYCNKPAYECGGDFGWLCDELYTTGSAYVYYMIGGVAGETQTVPIVVEDEETASIFYEVLDDTEYAAYSANSLWKHFIHEEGDEHYLMGYAAGNITIHSGDILRGTYGGSTSGYEFEIINTEDFLQDITLSAYATSNALNSYYTKTLTDNKFLQKTDAANTYLTSTTASNTYLSRSLATELYLAKTVAANTYFTQADATTMSGIVSGKLDSTTASTTYETITNCNAIRTRLDTLEAALEDVDDLIGEVE